MAGILDFLFGSDALKKAAGTPSDTPPPSRGDAGIDMGRLAQESANRQKSASAPAKSAPSKSPLSTTMTPMGPKAPPLTDADLTIPTKKATK